MNKEAYFHGCKKVTILEHQQEIPDTSEQVIIHKLSILITWSSSYRYLNTISISCRYCSNYTLSMNLQKLGGNKSRRLTCIESNATEASHRSEHVNKKSRTTRSYGICIIPWNNKRARASHTETFCTIVSCVMIVSHICTWKHNYRMSITQA